MPAKRQTPIEDSITSAQHKALVELAFNGIEVGGNSTFDSLWRRGFLGRDGGRFFITGKGLHAIDRDGMTPAPLAAEGRRG